MTKANLCGKILHIKAAAQDKLYLILTLFYEVARQYYYQNVDYENVPVVITE